MGCHALLQAIFLTQGLGLHLVSPALAGRLFTTHAMWEAPGGRQFLLNPKLRQLVCALIHVTRLPFSLSLLAKLRKLLMDVK